MSNSLKNRIANYRIIADPNPTRLTMFTHLTPAGVESCTWNKLQNMNEDPLADKLQNYARVRDKRRSEHVTSRRYIIGWVSWKEKKSRRDRERDGKEWENSAEKVKGGGEGMWALKYFILSEHASRGQYVCSGQQATVSRLRDFVRFLHSIFAVVLRRYSRCRCAR